MNFELNQKIINNSEIAKLYLDCAYKFSGLGDTTFECCYLDDNSGLTARIICKENTIININIFLSKYIFKRIIRENVKFIVFKKDSENNKKFVLNKIMSDDMVDSLCEVIVNDPLGFSRFALNNPPNNECYIYIHTEELLKYRRARDNIIQMLKCIRVIKEIIIPPKPILKMIFNLLNNSFQE